MLYEVITAEDYNAAVEQVVQLTMAYNKISSEVLIARGPFMEKEMTDIMQSARMDNDMEAVFYSSQALRQLLIVITSYSIHYTKLYEKYANPYIIGCFFACTSQR